MTGSAARQLSRGLSLCACVVGVVYLAANSHDGWGWLIFLAICLL